ncbi:MAG TPA: CHASE2 domain-containing protein, partial [Candidatus Solibacter sp.]|nr:CHASE2 domain-containing protein [Candidatus Solibacter sp.]
MAPPPATGQPAGFLQKWWGHRVPLAISLGISIIFLLLYYYALLSERSSAAANILQRFELSTVDTRFLLREKLAKPSPDPRIIIVEIDQKAQETLGRWPFSRKFFADALDILRE